MNAATIGQRTAPPNEDTQVLHARPLRPGVVLCDTARFADDDWPLAPASVQGQQRGLTLRFDTVPVEYRPAMKRLIYTLLSGTLPADETRSKLSSVVSVFYNVAVFLRWLAPNHDSAPISLVSEGTLLRFQTHLLHEYRSRTRRHALRAAVAFLWRFRATLGDDALAIDPRTVSGWKEPHKSASENTTARIPDAVHSRVLIWALRFVDDFAEDILGAVGIWHHLRTQRREPMKWGENAIVIPRRINAALHAGKPLPGFNGSVNYNALSRVWNCNRRALEDYVEEITAAAETLGVSDYAALGAPITAHIDDRPWIAGIALDAARDDSLTVLTQMLQAACYIVIAFLSGMRDSEVKHLRRGCSQAHKDHNGVPYRWTVSSLAFKGEVDPTGVPATWVIGAPAARAISILERLHIARSHDKSDWLFAPIQVGPGAGSGGRRGNTAMTSAGTNRQLNRFVSWVDAYCRDNARADTIPLVDGRAWVLSTRQFRRTLAWYIARRPGGSIAGAIAYRHHSIQMFEGYAGTSDSGFRAEVEAEQALARGEHLLALVDQHEHVRLTGPAADEAERRLEEMNDHPGFAGTITTDRKRFLRLISVHGPEVYPGRYAMCVYNRRAALCRKAGSEDATPDQSNCKPLTCRNVALTADNRETWVNELAMLDANLASRPSLPPVLEARLTERRRQILKLLEREDAR